MTAFFSLLRCAMGTEAVTSASKTCRRLDAREWEEVLSLAGAQMLTGLVYQALSVFPWGIVLPRRLVVSFAIGSADVESRARAVDAQARELTEALKAEGLSPVLMKGPAVAAYYPQPFLRVSGDIDLYFRQDEYPRALAYFRGKGLVPESTPDGDVLIRMEPTVVELHRHYFDLHLRESDLPPVPSVEAELLMLGAHILKHALGPGVGLRQVCDLAMAYRALEGFYDKAALRHYYERSGIGRWGRMLHSYLAERLGVDSGVYPSRTSWEPLERIVLRGGDFGHHTTAREKALGSRPLSRKLDTARLLIGNASFGLRYARREYLFYILDLVRGNLSAGRRASAG